MARQAIKVSVASLIEAIEASKTKVDAEYVKELQEFEVSKGKYAAALKKALVAASKKAPTPIVASVTSAQNASSINDSMAIGSPPDLP